MFHCGLGGKTETKSDREHRGRGRRRRRKGGVARGGVLEHKACCVDLIKFGSVLFAGGRLSRLYLYSTVC